MAFDEIRHLLDWPSAKQIRIRFRVFCAHTARPLTRFITTYATDYTSATLWIGSVERELADRCANDIAVAGMMHRWDHSPHFMAEFIALGSHVNPSSRSLKAAYHEH